MDTIAAVIVTYSPDCNGLKSLLKAISKQVAEVIIVDNTPHSKVVEKLSLKYKCRVISLEKNLGIASAQNIGIRKAIECGHSEFLLLDQDSLPYDDMVEALLDTRRKAIKSGINVAAVGPQQVDLLRNSIKSDFVTNEDSKIRLINSSEKEFCSPLFLIASGCLISQKVLEAVGYMEDELFIDCVDLEWGLRALNYGYVCIGSFEAKMAHQIGEKPIKLFGRELTSHSPLRHYYFYRNFYLLCKRNYIPYFWKKHVILKSTIQAVIFMLIGNNRLEQVKMIIKGIYHGLSGKAGKYE